MADGRSGPESTCEHCGGTFRQWRKNRNSPFCKPACAYNSRIKFYSDSGTCETCHRELPLAVFRSGARPNRPREVYFRSTCNECRSESRRGKATKTTREKNRDTKYGLMRGEYDGLVLAQQGRCAICLNPPGSKGLVVDHDHETSRVRGLLCQTCNSGIGMLRDDPATLRNAAEYIEERTWLTRTGASELLETQPRPVALAG